MTTKKLVPALAIVGALTLAGCSSGSGSAAPSPSTTTAAPSASTPSTSGSSAGAGVSTTVDFAAKVSANDASQAEIAAALSAAGVANANRWAGEVVEYRPYSDAAQGFPRLRDELAKYNPPDGTIDQIIAVLAQ